MRLIITYYTGFLQKRTDKLDIDSSSTTTNLLQNISNKIGRPIKDLKVKFKRDGYTLKVLPGWPLSHYDFQQGNNINVEIRESEQEQKKKESTRVNARYLNKLGIGIKQQLDVVSEGSFGEEDTEETHQASQGKVSGDLSFQNMSSDDEGFVQQPKPDQVRKILLQFNISQQFNEKKFLDQFQEKLFRTIKKNNVEDIDHLIENSSEYQQGQISQTVIEQLKEKKVKLLNDADLGGWNPIHFVAFQNYPKLVTYLLQKGVDINKVTSDGWSPLQLAIHKNNIEVLKTFLSLREIDVNLITAKGLALNLACKSGKTNMVQMLLQGGADPSKKDENGVNAAQCCTTQEIVNIVNQALKKKQTDSSLVQEKLQKSSGTFQPPKPPIVKGFIYKTGALLVNTNYRYLVLNPDEGTLIRYKSIHDYPLNPLEIIPLRNIRCVQMAEKQWFMKGDLHYFEVFYTSRLILACKYELSARAWVSFLYQAAVYSIYIESKMQQENIDEMEEHHNGKQINEIIIKDDKEQLDFDTSLIVRQNNQPQKISQQPEKNIPQIQKKPSPIQSVDAPVLPLSKQISIEENQNQTLSQTSTSTSNQTQTQNQNSKLENSGLSESALSQADNDLETKNEIKSLVKDCKVNFESFEVLKVLGSGAFGKVFLVRKKDDDRKFAMKALKKRNLIIKKQLKYAVTEANVLKSCNHPFILGLHYAFQTPNYLYLVLDYCPGGDLSYHLAQKTKFSEEDARFYIAELILAIEYLHQQNVVYRDLKPENILLHESGHIKLADFGLSKEGVGDADKTKSFCGSPAYLSPEMLGQKGAGKMSDIYGIGATFYELVTGEPPYYSDDIPTMYKNIKEGQLKLPKNLTEDAKNFIKKLLERDPTKRLGAKDKNEIKNEPFFKSIDFNKLYNLEYKPPITDFAQLQDDEDDQDDIGYKGKVNNFQQFIDNQQVFNDYDYSDDNVKVNRVIKFSFTRGADKQ